MVINMWGNSLIIKRSGTGTFDDATGDVYEGEFANGLFLEGKGKFTWLTVMPSSVPGRQTSARVRENSSPNRAKLWSRCTPWASRSRANKPPRTLGINDTRSL